MKWLLSYRPGDALEELHHCVATVGVFDGVHVGHRAILDRTLNWARTEGRAAVVITFGVHPDKVVHGRSPTLLHSLAHRQRELARCGIDATLVLSFDEKLRQMPAEEFVARILVKSLQIRGLVLGHDTAVGKDRRGDARLLTALGRQQGFEVQSVGELALDGEVVSSSRIREAYRNGRLDQVTRLLGRAPSILGTVEEGKRRGRTLGFPTANLACPDEGRPSEGVYAVLVLRKGQRHEGICNIGHRPTFEDSSHSTVEVHLLDFDGDLYGEELEVLFLARLRSEQRFDGPEQLIAAIRRDREAAEEVFRRTRGHLPNS